MLAELRRWGCPVEPHWRDVEGIDAVLAFCEAWREKRHQLPFETDGVVVKLNDLGLRARLGTTSKFPRWATAFKYPAQQATTRLRKIEVNIGRTGAATPSIMCAFAQTLWRTGPMLNQLNGNGSRAPYEAARLKPQARGQ